MGRGYLSIRLFFFSFLNFLFYLKVDAQAIQWHVQHRRDNSDSEIFERK